MYTVIFSWILLLRTKCWYIEQAHLWVIYYSSGEFLVIATYLICQIEIHNGVCLYQFNIHQCLNDELYNSREIMSGVNTMTFGVWNSLVVVSKLLEEYSVFIFWFADHLKLIWFHDPETYNAQFHLEFCNRLWLMSPFLSHVAAYVNVHAPLITNINGV